jgi:uncharacterized protein YceK
MGVDGRYKMRLLIVLIIAVLLSGCGGSVAPNRTTEPVQHTTQTK